MIRWIPGILVALFSLACGGTPAPMLPDVPADDGLRDLPVVLDPGQEEASAPPEVTPELPVVPDPGEDPGTPDAAETVDADVIGDQPDVNEGLVPCEDASDCENGVCSDGPDGKVCAPSCAKQECPAGWACRAVTVGGVGRIEVCLYPHVEACRPCEADAECGSVAGLYSNYCVELGPEGSFCSSACSKDTECPDGYRCAFITLAPGQTAYLCRRKGACTCSPRAVEEGARTACHSENNFGFCEGTRTCTAEGLTACSAALPGVEICNGLDDNCDGLTDPPDSQGCTPRFVDADGDEFGFDSAGCLCEAAAGTALSSGDCNDEVAAVSPGAAEVCNRVDDNCDGVTDEPDAGGCKTHWPDADNDGFGGGDQTQCLCAPVPGFPVDRGGDCNDAEATIRPGVTEACNGIDDDCDGVTDSADATGCAVYRKDADRDGFGSDETACLCAPAAPFDVVDGLTDCDDTVATIFPGAPETCNGRDDDCDGLNDPDGTSGCEDLFADADGDGHGALGSTPRCLCGPDGDYRVTIADDCRDDESAIHPLQAEVCNGVDDNCDGTTDPEDVGGCTVLFQDVDGDGYGDPVVVGRCLCAPAGFFKVLNDRDCNDADVRIHPAATEVCNRKDDNCDGATDPDGLPGSSPLYLDQDGDGWGVGDFRRLCFPIAPWSASKVGDCDDGDARASPGLIEVCNGYDDNCDGYVDTEGSDGCAWYHKDVDRDGFGSEYQKCLCATVGDWTAAAFDDCCDGDDRVHPGQAEWFGTANACGTFDYDCDEVETKRYPTNQGGCQTSVVPCTGTSGWLGNLEVPSCGSSGKYVSGCLPDCTSDDRVVIPQPCR